MSRLLSRRVTFSPEADARLKRLKGQTGVTPNLLCRIGFCMSLSERSPPNPNHYPPGDRQINRYTLLGEFDELFVALLRQRLFEDELDWSEHGDEQFSAHMNRGVLLIAARTNTLGDLLAGASTT